VPSLKDGGGENARAIVRKKGQETCPLHQAGVNGTETPLDIGLVRPKGERGCENCEKRERIPLPLGRKRKN